MTGPAGVRVHADPTPWPLLGPLPPASLALLVIDMQIDFVDQSGWLAQLGVDVRPMQRIVDRIARLLQAARRAGVPVLHTRQGNADDLSDVPPVRALVRRMRNSNRQPSSPVGLARGSQGWQIVAPLTPRDGEPVIDKLGFSAFAGTDLHAVLHSRGVEAVAICGVTANVCVLATALAAVDLGFEVLLVDDAIAADDVRITESTLQIVAHEGALFGARSTTMALIDALALV